MSSTKRVIGVLVLLLALVAPCAAGPVYIDTVVSASAGIGAGVECFNPFGPTYTGACGAGVFDPLAVIALDGVSYALGGANAPNGSIIVGFSANEVVDGSGADLAVYDSFGVREGFTLEASLDGTAFTLVGSFGAGGFPSCSPTCVTLVDLGGALPAARFLRITALTGESVFNYPEALDIDTVEALNYKAAVPDPGSTLLLLGMGLAGLRACRKWWQ
jgi:hypothetical protein